MRSPSWKSALTLHILCVRLEPQAEPYPLQGLPSTRALPVHQHAPLAAVFAQLAPKRAQAHLTGAGKAVRPKCPCGAQANRTRHASAIDDYRMSNLVWRSGNLPLRYRDCVVLP